MKILFINRWVGYNEGGNETHIKELISELNKKNHTIHVLTTNGGKLKPFEPAVKVWNVPSKRSYYTSRFGYFHAALFLATAFLKFFYLRLRGERYDVLSIHFSLEGFLARSIRAFFGIPYVFVFAGDTDLELIEGRYANANIQISNYMMEESKSYGYVPLVIPKGIDTSRFNYTGDSMRDALCSRDEKLVLTVCRLEPRKDLSTLIRAAKIVNEINPEVKFVIAGNGCEREQLEHLVSELNLQKTVRFLGEIPYTSNTLPKFYRSGDLFVLPTLYEGFGWVFMEAMACGLPILTTNAGSNPEVVGDVGVLFPPKQPEILAQKILELFSNPIALENMRKRGFEKLKQYEWSGIVEKYISVYDRVAKTPHNGHLFIEYLNSISDTLHYVLNVKKKKRSEWGPSLH